MHQAGKKYDHVDYPWVLMASLPSEWHKIEQHAKLFLNDRHFLTVTQYFMPQDNVGGGEIIYDRYQGAVMTQFTAFVKAVTQLGYLQFRAELSQIHPNQAEDMVTPMTLVFQLVLPEENTSFIAAKESLKSSKGGLESVAKLVHNPDTSCKSVYKSENPKVKHEDEYMTCEDESQTQGGQ